MKKGKSTKRPPDPLVPKEASCKTPSFVLELPLRVDGQQAKHLHAHLEAARCLYNALLHEAMKRLSLMRADPAWASARALSATQKQERSRAYAALRKQYGFCEYALHEAAKGLRCTWIKDHIDSTMAQTLATRAYQAANRVCLGQAKKVRFKSRGHGLDSVEGKRNDTGLRFVLQATTEGNAGYLCWGTDRIAALIDWEDVVIKHGLDQRIKYCRLVRRKAAGLHCQAADQYGDQYAVQLIVEGTSYQKPKHQQPASAQHTVLGLDLGPSTLAIVARSGAAQLVPFCEELRPNAARKRRAQRKLDRQRRATNPDNYDARGRIKKQGKHRLFWKASQGYRATRRQVACEERRLAAHRKSLQGKLAHEVHQISNEIHLEKTSFKGWQRQYGRSVGLHAPGMFVERVKRLVARTGGTLVCVSTYHTKCSQYCHGCKQYVRKKRSQRWHHCPCGIGPVQRDLYSGFLLAHLHPPDLIPSITQETWAGAEPHLRAVMELLQERAKAGESFPQSLTVYHNFLVLPVERLQDTDFSSTLRRYPKIEWPGILMYTDDLENCDKQSALKAWVFPVPECVGSKVLPHQELAG